MARSRSIARRRIRSSATEPPRTPDQVAEIVAVGPEGLIGNRMMTVRVDARGSTQDVYYPTVGLHSDVRPAEGDLPQSRSHFRAIVGGLAIRRRHGSFSERLAWQVFQHYQGATNLLVTELTWRRGPIRVLITDLVAMGPVLPRTAGGTESPGQYLKRFRIINDGAEDLDALFGLFVQAEVNGGIGEPGLSWHDGVRALLATNRGHGHSNRKLARDSTVEFAIALDHGGPVECEPTGDKEALLHRPVRLPAGQSVTVDLLVSGAFTGWRGDAGTFQHWLGPALDWFRSADLDHVEQATAQEWDAFIEPVPNIHFPRPSYAVSLRRSALAAALHADARWGAIASGFDRGLNAYCWPRSALWAGSAFEADRARPDRPQGLPVARRHQGAEGALFLLVPEEHDRRLSRVGDPGRRPDGDDPLAARAALRADRRPRLRGELLADGRAGGRRLRRRLRTPGAPLARRPLAHHLGRDLGQPLRRLPLFERLRRRRTPLGREAGQGGESGRGGGGGRGGRPWPTGSGTRGSCASRSRTAGAPG